MRPQVAILDDFQNVAKQFGGWSAVEARCDVTAFNDHVFDETDLAERLQPFDVAVIMRERTPFPRSLIERLPNLKLIATSGMINRAVDLEACAAHGVIVSGTMTAGDETAQLAFALILALLQQIPDCDRDVRAGRWQTGLGEVAAGKTIGIAGLGRIGKKIAEFAKVFGMVPIAWSQNLSAGRAALSGATYVEKDDLFRRADVVTLHLVLSDRTRGVVGDRELRLMKPSAYLVNTARSRLVDGRALVAALGERRIAGAAIDVYDVEPVPADDPLLAAPNTILTPHIGYVSKESYRNFYSQLVEDVEAWLDGRPIRVISV